MDTELTERKKVLEKYLAGLGLPRSDHPSDQVGVVWSAYNLLTRELEKKFQELRGYCSELPEYRQQIEPSSEESELVGHVLSEINPLLTQFETLLFMSHTIEKFPQNLNEKLDRYWIAYTKFMQRTRVKGLQIKPLFSKISGSSNFTDTSF